MQWLVSGHSRCEIVAVVLSAGIDGSSACSFGVSFDFGLSLLHISEFEDLWRSIAIF